MCAGWQPAPKSRFYAYNLLIGLILFQSHSYAMTRASTEDKVRLDRWLWAARFFKTRRLAKEAIDGGKVACGGQRVKASKDIAVGDNLTIRQGYTEKEVLVTGLSDKRRGAAEAALLYEETIGSKILRDKLAADGKAGLAGFTPGDHKPSKKERRQIKKFQEGN
jgi:ribosome-associated heat shock protein Hsp15